MPDGRTARLRGGRIPSRVKSLQPATTAGHAKVRIFGFTRSPRDPAGLPLFAS
ncbi:MAG: hypothetical protein JWP60_30 [Ramlibacter sp.]|nr:hypothetical protein [Ramlibacter sp.]